MLLAFSFLLVPVSVALVAPAIVLHCRAHRSSFGMPAFMLGAGHAIVVVLERPA